jgi:hypothetical protein
MCVNCMAGAMAAGTGASGLRAWLGVRLAGWLTPRRRKILTVGLRRPPATARISVDDH